MSFTSTATDPLWNNVSDKDPRLKIELKIQNKSFKKDLTLMKLKPGQLSNLCQNIRSFISTLKDQKKVVSNKSALTLTNPSVESKSDYLKSSFYPVASDLAKKPPSKESKKNTASTQLTPQPC